MIEISLILILSDFLDSKYLDLYVIYNPCFRKQVGIYSKRLFCGNIYLKSYVEAILAQLVGSWLEVISKYHVVQLVFY
jgi:hypothetical protein